MKTHGWIHQAIALLWLLVFGANAHAGSLSDTPLSLKGGVPPNVMFALSVEYPTANTAAYQDTASYAAANTYLGIFDPDKCYFYDSGNQWFYPAWWGDGSHGCQDEGGGWSGNILNWATMTGLDEFRYAMTGGNRYRDTSTLTVLERSYQSGQGGTSNFPNKTYYDPDSDATTYPGGTTITFANQGLGSRVSITPSTAPPSETLTCNSPFSPGGPSCASMTTPSGSYNCTTWTGTGSSASPYRCTAVAPAGPELPPTSITAISPPASVSSGATATSATCTNPSLTGSAFNCDLTLATGSTGTCTSWAGDGSAGTPYACGAFSTFSGGEVLTVTGAAAATSFTASVSAADVIDPSSSTYITCSVSSATPKVTSCTLTAGPLSGQVATCNTYSGSGSSSSPYVCSGFSIPGGGTYVTSSPKTGSSTTVVVSTKYYRRYYRITYTPPPVATTKYYIPSYTGTYGGTTTYYTGAYTLGFGGAVVYYVRVKVCDPAVGQESNCKQYGSSWKPTGVLQDNGDKMRFGVTSYFQANDIDNAVLRSKLKYIAPTKYSPSGGLVTNSQKEWSEADGTLNSNPDSGDAATATSFVGAMSNTGVINYINKFGATALTYKTYDVIGKLYYETLKYLRGSGTTGTGATPTLDFYRGAKSTNADGFPVITTWDDPVLYACQKNYIIAMGDTHTWCDKRLPGGSFTTVGSTTCNAYTDGNSNAHVQDTGSLAGDSGVNVSTEINALATLEGRSAMATTATGAGSSSSYYMAGLSKWAASKDIRTDFAGRQTVKTFIIDVQEYKDCGYNSQFWYAAKYGNPASYDDAGTWLTTSNPWSQMLTLPASACSSRAPTGYDAAGGAVTWPANLLRAGDPKAMIDSVKGAISAIVAQIGDEAALAQSSGFLDTGTGAYIYRATYNSGGWRGDVEALTIDPSGNVSSTPAWKATDKLAINTSTATPPAPPSRTIFTFNDGYDASGTAEVSTNARSGIEFTAANFGNLATGQQAALDADEFGTTDSLGADRIDYLRGNQAKEAFWPPGSTTPNPTANYGWRSRLSLVGDIISSNPVFKGVPASGYADDTYKAFATTYAGRRPMIYVGANDGMLHAFDASFTVDSATGMPLVTTTSGAEKFAYVPSAVYNRLSQYMASGYNHKYYVDGSAAVEDACFGTCAAATDWKTVLVSGLNAGGQGIFALDVTDPDSAFAASKVLWEFTEKDDHDLGYTFSKPIIRKLNNGKWAAIFGNGFNNTNADVASSTTGRAYLYILHLDGPGTGNHWTLGTDYFKIELKSPSEGASPTLPLNPPNGLSSVTGLDADLNGTVDFIYAGDRKGNLWKLDLTGTQMTVGDSSSFSVGQAVKTSANATAKVLSIPNGTTIVLGSVSGSAISAGQTLSPSGGSPTTPITAATVDPALFGSAFKFASGDTQPLFSASSSSGAIQQITTGLSIVRHPYGGYLLTFGTGSWIDQTDPLAPFVTEALYGIWDNGSALATLASNPARSDRSKLQQQQTLLYVDSAGNAANASSVPYTATSLDANGDPVFAVYSNCVPNWSTSTTTSNLSEPLCPAALAYSASTSTPFGQQSGWFMDLPGSGERIRSTTPQIKNQGALVTFTTLVPTTDPCSGNTTGLEHNLDTINGGSPSAGVYVVGPGGSGKVSVAGSAFSGYTGGAVSVVLGGHAILGGASDNAVVFNIRTVPNAPTPPTNMPNPPSSNCVGAACPGYVPGWGFLMNLQGATAGAHYVWSCHPPQFGTGAPICEGKYKYGAFGRISWKQILQ